MCQQLITMPILMMNNLDLVKSHFMLRFHLCIFQIFFILFYFFLHLRACDCLSLINNVYNIATSFLSFFLQAPALLKSVNGILTSNLCLNLFRIWAFPLFSSNFQKSQEFFSDTNCELTTIKSAQKCFSLIMKCLISKCFKF